jgi:hypothetical protein
VNWWVQVLAITPRALTEPVALDRVDREMAEHPAAALDLVSRAVDRACGVGDVQAALPSAVGSFSIPLAEEMDKTHHWRANAEPLLSD